jgi:hypothetical protein
VEVESSGSARDGDEAEKRAVLRPTWEPLEDRARKLDVLRARKARVRPRGEPVDAVGTVEAGRGRLAVVPVFGPVVGRVLVAADVPEPALAVVCPDAVGAVEFVLGGGDRVAVLGRILLQLGQAQIPLLRPEGDPEIDPGRV